MAGCGPKRYRKFAGRRWKCKRSSDNKGKSIYEEGLVALQDIGEGMTYETSSDVYS